MIKGRITKTKTGRVELKTEVRTHERALMWDAAYAHRAGKVALMTLPKFSADVCKDQKKGTFYITNVER